MLVRTAFYPSPVPQTHS